ncbi:MAG: hypothetical protein ACRCVU_13785 [Flavobacterium sp.]
MSRFKVGDIVIINRVTSIKTGNLKYELENYRHLHGKCGVIKEVTERGSQPYIVKVDNREWYVHDISLIEEENE